jgi:hypothetical protein
MIPRKHRPVGSENQGESVRRVNYTVPYGRKASTAASLSILVVMFFDSSSALSLPIENKIHVETNLKTIRFAALNI